MSLSHSPILSTLASANVAMAALTSLVAWLIEPFGRAIDQDCLLSPIGNSRKIGLSFLWPTHTNPMRSPAQGRNFSPTRPKAIVNTKSPSRGTLSRAATSAQVCVDRGQASAHDAAIGESHEPLHRMFDAAVGPRPTTVDVRLHFSFLRALALIAAASLALMLPACWERVAPLIA